MIKIIFLRSKMLIKGKSIFKGMLKPGVNAAKHICETLHVFTF